MPLDNMAPGMGVTYQDLARLRKPEIPGAGLRVGLSGLAGWNYGKDEQAFKSLIDQMGPMAEQDAMLKQQGANEYMTGAPLRQETRNATLEALLQKKRLSPMEEATKVEEYVTKLEEGKKKRLEASAHIFAELADADPSAIPEILERYKDRIPPKFAEGSPEVVKARATGVIKGIERTGKIGLQHVKNESYQQVNREKLEAKERENEKQREHDRQMKLLQEAGKNGRLIRSQANIKSIEAQVIAIQNDPDLSPEEKSRQIKEWTDIKKSMQKEPPPTVNLMDMIGRKNKKPTESATPKYKEGAVYKDAKGNLAKYVNGKWEPVK